jgi:hypothetical protein
LRVRSSGSFRRVFAAKGTAVLENDASPGGPYFIGRISDHANNRSAEYVRVSTYAPEAFTLQYDGLAPGFVVVPMSFNADWQVTLDGHPVIPVLKDGVLPAIAVSEPSTIGFEYRPKLLGWLLPWLAVLAVMLLAMGVADSQVKKPAQPPSEQ